MTFKQLSMRFICAAEIIIVVWFLCCGSQGVGTLLRIKKKLEAVEKKVQAKQGEFESLQHEYEQWKNDPFYLEKQARERLAMSREGEIVFNVKRTF